MQATDVIARSKARSVMGRTKSPASQSPRAAKGVAAKPVEREIRAYIAIRDSLLEEVEKRITPGALERVARANEIVENFLQPARVPYEAQHLAEPDASVEQERCERVKARVAQLRV
ncbi:MAG: hypothetical protein ABI871_07995 [Chthoniobacterales bacterium]